MKALQILIVIALAITVYVFLRFITKRIWLFATLRRFAKKHGYVCKIPLSCIWPNNRNDYIVQLETSNTLYAIKLFGLLRKHCDIHFWSLKEYSATQYFTRAEYVGGTPIGQTGARRRSLGNKNWAVSSEKEVAPVLLISPANAPVRLSQTKVNHFEDLQAGERIENAVFADLDYLLRFIKNREKQKERVG